MNDIWQGTGAWQGWRLTTDHPASSYGQPVLVSPDGIPFGPGDIVAFSEVMTGPEAAEKWGVGESTIRNYANAGQFLPSEARRAGRSWLITKKGMSRVFGLRRNLV
jgi:hypothetical protein